MDILNQQAQQIIRQSDSTNRTNIEEENTTINIEWKRIITELETHIDILRDLSRHWDEFDKRIQSFENQLQRLDERNRNIDTVVRSRPHLEDTKNVVRVCIPRLFIFL